jgi:hypothetical protein
VLVGGHRPARRDELWSRTKRRYGLVEGLEQIGRRVGRDEQPEPLEAHGLDESTIMRLARSRAEFSAMTRMFDRFP